MGSESTIRGGAPTAGRIRILLVEEAPADGRLVLDELGRAGLDFEARRVEERGEFLAALEAFRPHLVLSDYQTHDFAGLAVLRLVQERRPQTPVIIVAAAIAGEAAVECIKAGAADYVAKERPSRLAPAVRAALDRGTLVEQGRRAEEARRRAEARLAQSQRVEAVGRLAGGVAHDFNNLLSVILGHAERLQRKLGAGHPARAEAVQIGSAVERAAVLTRQLLAFGRRQVLEPRIVRLDAVAAEARGSLDHVLGERIELVLLAPSALGHVRADPAQMAQVLLNLAKNARDAMPDGGRLTIEFADVTLDEGYTREHPPCEPGRYVMMAVTDTGMGMDSETSQRVFEPFFTTKPGAHEAGLGLATVYGIVKQSGGFIWVYSEPGVGTSFKVYLPRVDDPPEAGRLRAQPDAARPVARGARLLVVEDDDGMRELMADLLETEGYVVSAFGRPLVALETVAALGETPDLLVTDVIMPGISGRDLAHSLRSRQPGLRVLFVSGYAGESLSRRGEIDRGDRFLLKPFSEKALLQAVADALASPPSRETP